MSKANVSLLRKALQDEKRRSAALAAQLRNTLKGTSRHGEWIEEPSDVGEHSFEFMPRNSTMREATRSANDSSLFTSMSFASLQVTECKPMEGEYEVDKKTFEQWKDHFEAAMQFAGITSEFMKMTAFKMKAGSKLIDVLDGTISNDTTPNAELYPYSNVMQRLKNYYGSRDYVLLQRQKLRSMVQNPGEADLRYVKRVTGVAKLCDYKDEHMMETVADVIQAHAVNTRVREAGRKVLRKGGTIAQLLDKVRACEIEKLNEEMFAKNHRQTKTVAEVAAVSYQHQARGEFRSGGFERGPQVNRQSLSRYQSRNWDMPQGRNQARGDFTRHGATRMQRQPCWRCTSNYHTPEECHAIGKICRQCQGKGHIERACRLTEPHTSSKRRLPEEGEPSSFSKTRKIAAIMSTENSEDEKPKVENKPVSVTFSSENSD